MDVKSGTDPETQADAEQAFVVDEEASSHDSPDQRRLGQVRAKRTAMARQTVRRGRDWSLIGTIVIAAAGVQCVVMAAQKFRSENTAAGVIFTIFALLGFVAAVVLFARYRRLADAARKL